jgi:hypothetical protein
MELDQHLKIAVTKSVVAARFGEVVDDSDMGALGD